MSVSNALAEALHQLFVSRQLGMADALLDRCSREASEQLLVSPHYVLNGRIRYEVEDRLKHRKPSHDERAMPTLKALQHVMNTWCIEGRRTAIRAVLRELAEGELDELAAMPELDREIVSMAREFHD
jgi:hypothetical protein